MQYNPGEPRWGLVRARQGRRAHRLTTWRERDVWTWRVCRPMFSQGGDEPEHRRAREPVRFQGGATPPSLQLLPMLQGWGPDRYDFSITLSFCFPQLGHVPLSTAGHFVQTVSLPQPDKVRTVNHRINRSWTLCSSPNQNSCTAISGKVRLVPTSSWSARASRKVKVKSSWQKNHHLDYIYCFCPDPSLPTDKPQTPN